MDTLGDIRTVVQRDLNVASNSTLFSETTIDSAINTAYRKATALFRWPQLQDAKYTQTQAGINYYDAPDTWRPQSIWRLAVNHLRYGEEPDGSPISFSDWLDWKEDNADSTDKKWAMQWLRYFISPTPTESNIWICVWGQKNAIKLTSGSQETIFTTNMPECNEALALEALAILKKKGEREGSGQMSSQEAMIILTMAFNKFTKDTAKQEKIKPFLSVPDMFSRGESPTEIGKFNRIV